MKSSYKHLLQARQKRGTLSWAQIIAAMLGIFLLLISVASHAQNSGLKPAVLDDKGILQLPANLPLSKTYSFDLSQYKFSSSEAMLEFLSTKSGNDYFVRAQTENKLGILVLDLTAHPDWTLAEWNKHLAEATRKKPIKP